jgi:hypothetical protein
MPQPSDRLVAKHVGEQLVALATAFIEDERSYRRLSDHQTALMAARYAGRFHGLLDIGEIRAEVYDEGGAG